MTSTAPAVMLKTATNSQSNGGCGGCSTRADFFFAITNTIKQSPKYLAIQ